MTEGVGESNSSAASGNGGEMIDAMADSKRAAKPLVYEEQS